MDVDAGEVIVAYDPARTTPDDLCAALAEAGTPCTDVGEPRVVGGTP